MSIDLAAFLLARIAEDEEAARAATPGPWAGRNLFPFHDGYGRPADVNLAHVARWDPARVLAECEAKRRVVEAYQRNRDRIEANVRAHTEASSRGDLSALPTLRSAGWDLGGRDWALEMTLRFLALPYAGHPEYRSEWAP